MTLALGKLPNNKTIITTDKMDKITVLTLGSKSVSGFSHSGHKTNFLMKMSSKPCSLVES